MARRADSPEGRRGRAAWLVLAGVIVAGGLTWPVMKVGVADVSPHSFVTARLGLATVAAFLIAALIGRLRLPAVAELPAVAVVAGLQMGLFLWLITVGVANVPSGRAALLAYTSPLWVAPLSKLVLGEAWGRRTAAAFLLGIAGLAVLFNPLASAWASRAALLGNLALLGGALAWALQIVAIRRFFRQTAILALLPWQLLLATLAVGGIEVASGTSFTTGWTPAALAAAAYAGIVATALVFAGMLYVSRSLPSMVSSLGFLGVPAVGLASSVILLDEPLTPDLIAGFALIMASLLLLRLNPQGWLAGLKRLLA